MGHLLLVAHRGRRCSQSHSAQCLVRLEERKKLRAHATRRGTAPAASDTLSPISGNPANQDLHTSCPCFEIWCKDLPTRKTSRQEGRCYRLPHYQLFNVIDDSPTIRRRRTMLRPAGDGGGGRQRQRRARAGRRLGLAQLVARSAPRGGQAAGARRCAAIGDGAARERRRTRTGSGE